ncbi:hypothetical protein [Mycolicibacterium aubagnense]|uniref:DUF222 domain-containing protein n=1 Tax=Mycolicibacterium aubagnense TaxID=319707 RepID=A0ABM7I7V1_9MYCO|nr:hypothetical protein [Mycolicibacterium aubagnense]TLH63169.1 hypothetical protein C1S80_14610 [Mycolicibacterium aubagnense]WGI30494.1 hypothetical protein QDT91_14345 [Mycolicibacterium aubagnense]BBX82594.1 hypothetical protein MAUB_04670 [Mycolicibacterium aubagnense]
MTSESDIAWELVECVRARLTVAELNNAYVNLGIGEFDPVIQVAMTVVERERLSVPDALVDSLHTWRVRHHPDGVASERLARQIAQCRLSPDSRCGG